MMCRRDEASYDHFLELAKYGGEVFGPVQADSDFGARPRAPYPPGDGEVSPWGCSRLKARCNLRWRCARCLLYS